MSRIAGHVTPTRRPPNEAHNLRLAIRCQEDIESIQALIEANRTDRTFMRTTAERLTKLLRKLEGL